MMHDASMDPAVSITSVPESPAIRGPRFQQHDPSAETESKCFQCGSTGARNLVVCIDGTSNQFSTKNTNVVELYSRLEKDDRQLTFYNSGIGTYAEPSWKSLSYRKQVIENKLDLAFALHFEKIIISAYAWLVDNYQPGDRIFLFGFSRGAYQVRALAAMIHVVGLLYKGNNDQIPFAYELYAASDERDGSQGGKEDNPLKRLSATLSTRVKSVLPKMIASSLPTVGEPAKNTSISMQDQFKNTFSRPAVRIHFVGAWDTVSSVGFIRDKTLPKTTDGMKCTCFFRHALALHEFRIKFLPEYVNGSRGPDFENLAEGTEPHTKEVWFAGSHSDIGGGSAANTTLDKFGPALRWMSHEARIAGLRIKEGPRQWEQLHVSKSMTLAWRMVECLPIKRQAYMGHTRNYDDSESSVISDTVHSGSTDSHAKWDTTRLPHFGAHREIQPHQLIHRSVDRKQLPFKLPQSAMEEKDTYMDATVVLRSREDVKQLGCILDAQNMGVLQMLTSSADGIESLTELDIMDYIYNIARSCGDSKGSGAARILKDLRTLHVAYVKGSFSIRFRTGMELFNASDVTETTSSETFPFHICGHERPVSSVAFLSGARVVSGSWDGTVRIWDVSTGDMTLDSPLHGHSKCIHCVAVCPAAGLVASASDDGAVHLWSPNRLATFHAGEALLDEGGAVYAVAFSPDGSYFVSGSTDGAIRMWNAKTGKRLGDPVHGHLEGVRSVALSSDGRRIVSGSYDRTLQLWEWSPGKATPQPLGERLDGHTSAVYAVAFAPGARMIASGSRDRTVRLWDASTGALRSTLMGHAGDVNSVAFSPDGRLVASGSDDWTVRLWNPRTGAPLRVLRGHTGFVWSVAFSPDGTRIASGSDDNTLRVWDSDEPRREADGHGHLTKAASM